MRFGESYNTFKDKQTGNSGGGDYLRAFKEGDTVGVFLTPPSEWVGYLEHYNPTPGGYSFPCTQEDDCPGCNSELEKMRSRGAKVAIPMLVDEKWVNIYKVPKKFAERLAKRALKDMDREYTITRVGTSVDTDYDVESGDKVSVGDHEVPDIEKMLEETYDQVWGGGEETPKAPAAPASSSSSEKTPEEPGNRTYSEEELRDMAPRSLKKVLRSEGEWGTVPDEIKDSEDTDEIVDWMLAAWS